MRRLPYLAALAMMASLVMAPAALAQTRDLDCTTPGTDFGFQEDAQAVLAANPADPNGLDADGDGTACENLPEAVPGDDLACVNFATVFASRADAQAALDADLADPYGLDADGDGAACESTTNAGGTTRFEDDSASTYDTSGGTETASPPAAEGGPVAATPEPAAEPADTALPETGGPAPLLPAAGGLLLVAGLFGLRMARRG